MGTLEEAIDELYAGDLDQFVERRKQLVADVRSTGDKDAAKEIGALRKPTQAAFTVNRLARTDPESIAALVALGTELQQAQRSADAAALRELNRRRRTELNRLVRRAFDIIGQQRPSAGQREEVTATLQAALADPVLAAELQHGTLVKAAEASGFGFTPPELTVVRSDPPPRRPAPEPTSIAATRPDAPSAHAGRDRTPSRPAGPSAKERAAAAAAERTAAALAAAQAEVDAADTAVDAAVAAIDKDQQLIRALQRTLAETKQQLEDHKADAKAAEVRQRKARAAMNRLR